MDIYIYIYMIDSYLYIYIYIHTHTHLVVLGNVRNGLNDRLREGEKWRASVQRHPRWERGRGRGGEGERGRERERASAPFLSHLVPTLLGPGPSRVSGAQIFRGRGGGCAT